MSGLEAKKRSTRILQFKIDAVRNELNRNGNNKFHAAKLLGISIRTVRYYVGRFEELKEFRISPATKKAASKGIEPPTSPSIA